MKLSTLEDMTDGWKQARMIYWLEHFVANFIYHYCLVKAAGTLILLLLAKDSLWSQIVWLLAIKRDTF